MELGLTRMNNKPEWRSETELLRDKVKSLEIALREAQLDNDQLRQALGSNHPLTLTMNNRLGGFF